MASNVESGELENSLRELISNLQSSVAALKSRTLSAQLRDALHDDIRLPDQRVGELATEVIDLLGETEALLKPSHLILADHFLGYTDAKCLLAAVQLRIPDLLGDGSLSLEELAIKASAQPVRLKQILRPLYNNGIFTCNSELDIYTNNYVSRLLLRDHWTQWHNWVDLYGQEYYDIARGIPGSVVASATRSAAQINFDTDNNMFDHFEAHGLLPRLHRTLGGGATAMAPGILENYPWGEVADTTVMDIGGGSGAMLASLLRKYPTMKGGVYDLQGVISHISPFFEPGGQFEDVADRVPKENLIAGDFLAWVPKSEVYVMKWVLHDWKDEEVVKILRNIREAIVVKQTTSRLVILESILADGQSGRLARLGDINMMMMTANGQERTRAQWEDLTAKAGWSQFSIFPLRRSWVQAIELKP